MSFGALNAPDIDLNAPAKIMLTWALEKPSSKQEQQYYQSNYRGACAQGIH